MSSARLSIFQLREGYRRGLIERGDFLHYAVAAGWNLNDALTMAELWGEAATDARLAFVREEYATGDRTIEWLEEQIGAMLGLDAATPGPAYPALF
jgi:hypothetical protein